MDKMIVNSRIKIFIHSDFVFMNEEGGTSKVSMLKNKNHDSIRNVQVVSHVYFSTKQILSIQNISWFIGVK